jgi:hypothetical protein
MAYNEMMCGSHAAVGLLSQVALAPEFSELKRELDDDTAVHLTDDEKIVLDADLLTSPAPSAPSSVDAFAELDE